MSSEQRPKFDSTGMTQWHWKVLHKENFILGNNTQIGSFTVIDAENGVTIEDDVKIGWNCTIMSYSSIDRKSGRVILNKNSKIGANSVIFPNITIGENSVIGANSLVNRNIPPNEIWAGTPAKKIRNL